MGQCPSHITSSKSPYGNPFDQDEIATAFRNQHGIRSSEDDGGHIHMMQVDQGDINPYARAIQRVSQLSNNESTDPLPQLIENQVSEIFTEEIPVLMPPMKLRLEEIWGGSNLNYEATAYRSRHSGECSQDGGGGDDDHDSASPIHLFSRRLNNFRAYDQSQGFMPSGFLFDGLDMNMNTTTAQNKSFLGSEYGVKKIRKPRYAFQTRSAVDILDDGYRWKKYGQMGEKKIRPYYLAQHYAQKAVKNNKNWRYVPSLYLIFLIVCAIFSICNITFFLKLYIKIFII
uniref:WRKY transcription factor protein 26 n=1 Tax=Zanthoxylum armatum TaxID=67938 RepID=A0A8F1SZX2_9ROSI|nr:WRKY transcription factor protein 26 [Zanthoxylum armatum]